MPRYESPSSQGREVESIPHTPWNTVSGRVESLWLPDRSPHHSIIAQTGNGKSYLIVNGILPMIQDENVLIIDVKGDDETLAETGKPVHKIPSRFSRTFNDWLSEGKPREHWYRLVVSDDYHKARAQVRDALMTIYGEGKWTVVLDETRALTDFREPSLNLLPQVEQLWLRGRSRKVCVVAATQGPRWVPKSFYEQAQFHWIGSVEDYEAQKRLTEIGGMEKWHLEQIRYLPRFHYVYTDKLGDDGVRFRGITMQGK